MPNSLAHKLLKAAQLLVTAKEQMAWEGNTPGEAEDHFWPEAPKGFTLNAYQEDAFGATQKAEYEYSRGGDNDFLFAVAEFMVPQGKNKAGTWELAAGPYKKKGTWKDETEIVKVLSTIPKWVQEVVNKSREALKTVGGTAWEVQYDGFSLVAKHKGNGTEAEMQVEFIAPEEVLFGGKETATILFSQNLDADDEEWDKTYRSLEDMNKILAIAEKIWDRNTR